MTNQIKIQIINDYQTYSKGQIVELDEKVAINLLTSGKALRIHRGSDNNQAKEITQNHSAEPESQSILEIKDRNKKPTKSN